jgi:hypothetical protein
VYSELTTAFLSFPEDDSAPTVCHDTVFSNSWGFVRLLCPVTPEDMLLLQEKWHECNNMGLEEIPRDLRTEIQVCFSSKLKFVGCCARGREAFRTYAMRSEHTTSLQQLNKIALFTWNELIMMNKPDKETTSLINCMPVTEKLTVALLVKSLPFMKHSLHY